MALSDPSLIENSIKENRDGTFTVTFKGAPDEPITVTAPTDAELGLYDGGSRFGIWAPVMGKAFGQHRFNHAQRFQISFDQADTAQEGASGLGYAIDALSLLTGNAAEFRRIDHRATPLTNAASIEYLLATAIDKRLRLLLRFVAMKVGTSIILSLQTIMNTPFSISKATVKKRALSCCVIPLAERAALFNFHLKNSVE